MPKKHPAIIAIGLEVRARRVAIGLSQEDMAARVGVHRTYYSGLERGSFNLTATVLFRLSLGLECSPGDLLPDLATLRSLPPLPPLSRTRGSRRPS